MGFTYEIISKDVKNYAIRIKSDGEVIVTMPMRGSKKRAEQLVLEKSDWIERKLSELEQKTVLCMAESKWKWEDEDRLTWLMEQIYPQFHQYGIPFPKLYFRKMKGRWGSCEKLGKKVTLNKMLKYVSPECQEYVIAHELAHLVEANHGKGFYEVLSVVMPDYKKREKMLKNYVLQ